MDKFIKIFLFMCIIGVIIGIIVYWQLMINKRELFISSKTWTGKKQGYIFTRGNQGQGYYKDKLNK